MTPHAYVLRDVTIMGDEYCSHFSFTAREEEKDQTRDQNSGEFAWWKKYHKLDGSREGPGGKYCFSYDSCYNSEMCLRQCFYFC